MKDRAVDVSAIQAIARELLGLPGAALADGAKQTPADKYPLAFAFGYLRGGVESAVRGLAAAIGDTDLEAECEAVRLAHERETDALINRRPAPADPRGPCAGGCGRKAIDGKSTCGEITCLQQIGGRP